MDFIIKMQIYIVMSEIPYYPTYNLVNQPKL